jgi:4-carboxymuconolactone decarboxylase
VAKAKKSGERLARGRKKLRQIHGRGGEAVIEALGEIAPDLARYIVEFAFGDVYCRGGLTLRERQIATVAALVALGYPQAQLRSHIHGALNVGCSRKEILEIVIQMALYAGFPAASNAANSAQTVFRERDSQGIKG